MIKNYKNKENTTCLVFRGLLLETTITNDTFNFQ